MFVKLDIITLLPHIREYVYFDEGLDGKVIVLFVFHLTRINFQLTEKLYFCPYVVIHWKLILELNLLIKLENLLLQWLKMCFI